MALLGAAGGIGQPLALLLKMQPYVTELALYDIANTVGVAADLSHCNTSVKASLRLAVALTADSGAFCLSSRVHVTVVVLSCLFVELWKRGKQYQTAHMYFADTIY